jgi:threonine/homoserine/homoserine lactone efflux protein
VACTVDWIVAGLRERSGRTQRVALLMRRLSALVFVYLAIQFAVGQRTRS